ncbi:MAG: phage holin family protein [Gemmatimonadales bacterium]
MPELRERRGIKEERSLGELFGQLSEDMSLLFRQEIQLARAELSEKISRVSANLMSVFAGGLVAYVGGLAIVAALILGLHQLAGISPWISALIVGALLTVVGYSMLNRGLGELKRLDLAPRRTVENIKEDVQTIKDDVRQRSGGHE